MGLQQGDLVRLPGDDEYVEIDLISHSSDGGADLYVLRDGRPERVSITSTDLGLLEVLAVDGGAAPARVLAALWSQWMRQAAATTTGDLRKQYPIHEHFENDSEGQRVVRNEVAAEEFFGFNPLDD